MPTNLYGPGDNYHPTNSHELQDLIRSSGTPCGNSCIWMI